MPIPDGISEAVLSRADIARYLDGSHGAAGADARVRIQGYLKELQTTQRYPYLPSAETPALPILRKIERGLSTWRPRTLPPERVA